MGLQSCLCHKPVRCAQSSTEAHSKSSPDPSTHRQAQGGEEDRTTMLRVMVRYSNHEALEGKAPLGLSSGRRLNRWYAIKRLILTGVNLRTHLQRKCQTSICACERGESYLFRTTGKCEWAGNGKYRDVICFCFVAFLIFRCPWAHPGAGAIQTQHAGFLAAPRRYHC